MSERPKHAQEKKSLHPRNRHRSHYDFTVLKKACPELEEFVFINKYKQESIDFAKADAVKTLNRALLIQFYGIKHWDVPKGYLCPPVPGRADYIHNIADLLGEGNAGIPPKGKAIRVLDIGVGANCIYPIIGHQEYKWSFVGTDIDPKALEAAQKNLDANPGLAEAVELRLQKNSEHIFKGIIQPEEQFEVSICNPPFHASIEEAMAGTKRKWRNLGNKKAASKTKKPHLNFGGRNTELWYPGGEKVFIKKMMEESVQFGNQCRWFSTLISKKGNLGFMQHVLGNVRAVDFREFEMAQGQKVSRILAWTFQS